MFIKLAIIAWVVLFGLFIVIDNVPCAGKYFNFKRFFMALSSFIFTYLTLYFLIKTFFNL